MRRSLLVMTLLLLTIISSYGQEYTSIQNFVEVTGVAERQITPDRFELQIIIDEIATKGKVSVQELEADMVRMLKTLKIDCDKDLSIKYVSSDYAKRKGALSMATYILRLEDGELLQCVYTELSDLDITSLKLLKSYCSEQSKYEAEARNEALLNARETARGMAATFDQEIGACFYMNYNISYPTRSVNTDVVMVGYGQSRGNTMAQTHAPLSFEKQTITARVSTKFILRMPIEEKRLKF